MKKLSPRNAKTLNEICSLRTDHHDLKHSWILTDGVNVTITKQDVGCLSTESVTLPRREFNLLIDWYVKEQQTVSRN